MLNQLSWKKIINLPERIRERLTMNYQRLRRPKFVTIQGIKVCLGDYMSESIKDTLYLGKYEQSELQTVKHWLELNDVVMEIGAGIGLISSYCAKRIGSDRVFTYEANPDLKYHIHNNYKLNHVSPTLEICLIGKNNSEETFYLDKDFWASSINPRNSEAKPIKVPVKSFEQELKRINPTFLIIDVEGKEYQLLQQTNFSNIKKISIEIHPLFIGREKANLLKKQLTEAGFKMNKKFCNQSKDGLEELFFHR